MWALLLASSSSLGRPTSFLTRNTCLKAAYTNLSCELKVGAGRSELFGVSCGLRQGGILSPLLFLLYINSMVAKLKELEPG